MKWEIRAEQQNKWGCGNDCGHGWSQGNSWKGFPQIYAGPHVDICQLLRLSQAWWSRVCLRRAETSQILMGVGQQFDSSLDFCLRMNERSGFVCWFINQCKSVRCKVHKIWWLQHCPPKCCVHTHKLLLACNKLSCISHKARTYTHCNLVLKGCSLWWNTRLFHWSGFFFGYSESNNYIRAHREASWLTEYFWCGSLRSVQYFLRNHTFCFKIHWNQLTFPC